MGAVSSCSCAFIRRDWGSLHTTSILCRVGRNRVTLGCGHGQIFADSILGLIDYRIDTFMATSNHKVIRCLQLVAGCLFIDGMDKNTSFQNCASAKIVICKTLVKH